MSDILSDLEGVVCIMDDVLVHGHTQEEHDQHQDNVLQRMKEVGMTLNKDKCHFSQNQVMFLGQLIDRDGVHPRQWESANHSGIQDTAKRGRFSQIPSNV
jgi:hypothetical protein